MPIRGTEIFGYNPGFLNNKNCPIRFFAQKKHGGLNHETSKNQKKTMCSWWWLFHHLSWKIRVKIGSWNEEVLDPSTILSQNVQKRRSRSSPCPQKSFVSACNICLRPATQNLKKNWRNYEGMDVYQVIQHVTFLGWLSDPCKGLSDLQQGDKKVTLNHLVCMCCLSTFFTTSERMEIFPNQLDQQQQVFTFSWGGLWSLPFLKKNPWDTFQSSATTEKHLAKNWRILRPKMVRVFISFWFSNMDIENYCD